MFCTNSETPAFITLMPLYTFNPPIIAFKIVIGFEPYIIKWFFLVNLWFVLCYWFWFALCCWFWLLCVVGSGLSVAQIFPICLETYIAYYFFIFYAAFQQILNIINIGDIWIVLRVFFLQRSFFLREALWFFFNHDVVNRINQNLLLYWENSGFYR